MSRWVFYILWWFAGFAFCGAAVSMLLVRLGYEREYVRMDGRLEGVEDYPADRGIWRNPEFTFRAASGEKIVFRSALGHVWMKYATGDRFTVLHDPQTGRTLAGRFTELYLPVIVIGLFGLALLLSAAFPLVAAWYIQRGFPPFDNLETLESLLRDGDHGRPA